MVEEFTCTERI